jgi:hypothetical protein
VPNSPLVHVPGERAQQRPAPCRPRTLRAHPEQGRGIHERNGVARAWTMNAAKCPTPRPLTVLRTTARHAQKGTRDRGRRRARSRPGQADGARDADFSRDARSPPSASGLALRQRAAQWRTTGSTCASRTRPKSWPPVPSPLCPSSLPGFPGQEVSVGESLLASFGANGLPLRRFRRGSAEGPKTREGSGVPLFFPRLNPRLLAKAVAQLTENNGVVSWHGPCSQ